MVDPPGQQRDEASIYLDLARACNAPIFGSRLVQKIFELLRRVASRGGRKPALPQALLLSLLLRLTGNGSFRKLLSEPHGRLRPENRGGSYLGVRVVTDDGLVDLAPPPLLEQAAKLETDFATEVSNQRRLKLITRRHVRTHNSWTHNDENFVAGSRNSNYLYVHPEDARSRGLADGDLADVSSETGTVRVPVRLLPDLQPGTVALPHGWGHQHAAGLGVACKTSGVNVNLLAADGPDALERVSGMARLTGILVDVERASAPREPGNWSGIAPNPV
jgi:anaerobic selenocysteine-containing dehydrogenase